MVVARNQEAASFLCRAWRERESVQKVYLAHVRHWPPYHHLGMNEGKINLAMAPSRTERIKWEIIPIEEGGKECETYWKVFEDLDKNIVSEMTQKCGIILELHPMTGRTHQLRLHCAAIGSGIVGDSLYGDSPIAWVAGNTTNANLDGEQSTAAIPSALGTDAIKNLRLHAHKLSFPNPSNGKKMTFESPKSW